MLKQKPTLAQVRQRNRELVLDISHSPSKYLSIITQERGDIAAPQLLAEIELSLGRKYSNASNTVRALKHLTKGQKMMEALPQSAQDTWWIGMMHHWYGNTYVEKLDFEQTLHHYFLALKPFREGEHEWQLNNARLKIGHVMLRMGAGDEAIKYIKSAMADSKNYPKVIVTAYYLMGIAYQAIGDYEQAAQYYDKHFHALDNPYKIFAALTQAITCYIELGELDKAGQLLAKATALETTSELNPKRRVNLLIGQATMAIAQHAFDLALSKCNEALALANQTNNLLNQAKAQLHQAEILYRISQLTDSQSVLEAFTKTKLPTEIQSDANRLLLRIYRQTGQWEKAFRLVSEIGETALFTQSRLRSIEALFDSRQHEQALQRKNDELVALHAEKDELLRIVAHDLMNPLSAALMTVELLSCSPSKYYSPEQQQKMFNRVHGTLLSAVDITSQLTGMAEAEAEEASTTLETVAIDKLIATVVAENVPLAQGKAQRLVVGYLAPISTETNPVWLKQILSNLISNAIKYSLAGATTTVSLQLDPTKTIARIAVQDEGLGLDKDDLRHVFTKYKRLSAKPTGNESSTGLGLYITKVTAEKLGGTVSVTSVGKNKGSTFVLTLPTQQQS